MRYVKRLRKTASGAGLLLWAAISGCAFHEMGLVKPADGVVSFETMEGKTLAVKAVGEAEPLAFLDGHSVEIWGTRIGKQVHVSDWKIPEGLHGMGVWVGPVLWEGRLVGIDDRNSHAQYVFDEDGADALKAYEGQIVMVEGYVEGAHVVHVEYFRPLFAE